MPGKPLWPCATKHRTKPTFPRSIKRSKRVPEVASQLWVQTVGGTGNLDLALFTAGNSEFDCVSANPGTVERCRIADPSADFWRSQLQLWDPTVGVGLNESYALPVQYEVESFRGGLETDALQSFGSFPVAPGSQFSVVLDIPGGNPDLYLRWDAEPDLDNWDCRPFGGRFEAEVCDVPVPDGAAVAHVSLHHNTKRIVPTKYDLTVISAEVL